MHETVDVVGRASSEVVPGVLAALAGDGTLQVLQVAPGSIQCVRNRRPTWATVAGVVGLLFCGLGVLFFFVRRTEMCTITVVDGPRGAVVTLSGVLDEQVLLRIHGCFEPSGAAPAATPAMSLDPSLLPPLSSAGAVPVVGAPPPAVVAPPPPPAPPVAAPWTPSVGVAPTAVGPDADRTVARGALPSAPPAAVGFRVRFDHGAVAEVHAPILVGRDPAATADGLLGATLFAVPDPTMSVSKTHLVLRAHQGLLWVDDLNSTNGTAILHPNGERVAAAPGTPIAVGAGAVIEFGDRRAEVLAG